MRREAQVCSFDLPAQSANHLMGFDTVLYCSIGCFFFFLCVMDGAVCVCVCLGMGLLKELQR